MNDIVFYMMDAGVFVMFAYMLWRSQSIVIPAKVSGRWLVAGMFLLLGAAGFLNYRTPFTWIQLAFMALIAGMYMMLKSGLSEDGIIMTGSFISYDKAGRITLYKKDHFISFHSRGNRVDLHFEEGQMDEVRAWLKKHASKGITNS